jgi:hypothetical protein
MYLRMYVTCCVAILGRSHVSCDRMERLESVQCFLWEGREAAHTLAAGCTRIAGEVQWTCGIGATETLYHTR